MNKSLKFNNSKCSIITGKSLNSKYGRYYPNPSNVTERCTNAHHDVKFYTEKLDKFEICYCDIDLATEYQKVLMEANDRVKQFCE